MGVYSLYRMRTTTQVISGGRVTIRRQLRAELNLDEGDLVEIEIRPVDTHDQDH